MDRRLKILLFVLVYFIVCAKSCVDDKSRTDWEVKHAEIARDSILVGFEAAYLSEDARTAAEITAIHKLEDLSDYLEIYANVSMDSIFRAKAGEMISGIFISDDCKLSFGVLKQKKIKSISLEKFMENGLEEDMLRSRLIFDSIRVLEPLQKADQEMYSGKLSAFQTIIKFYSADSVIYPSEPVTIQFISSKTMKILGQDTLKVWEVKLGDLMKNRDSISIN